jgi:hypothetical protein
MAVRSASIEVYSLLIRHSRRARKHLLSVLSWCIHCVCRALEPTPAVSNHWTDRQRLRSSQELAVHAPCEWRYDQLLRGGYSLLTCNACRACKRLLSVLSWCIHCVCRALEPTPAVSNH